MYLNLGVSCYKINPPALTCISRHASTLGEGHMTQRIFLTEYFPPKLSHKKIYNQNLLTEFVLGRIFHQHFSTI